MKRMQQGAPSRRRRLVTALVIGTASVVALAACSSGSSSSSGPGTNSGKKISLKIADWGDFGLKGLIAQYKTLHPNVTITEVTGDYNTTHQNLQKFLVAGSGAPDISAIDEGFIISFRNQASKFVDLGKLDASLKSAYIPWKWDEATQGGQTIGLGTDVGGLAMCYRTDLFKKAGLPTDRNAVSKLWPTWDDYVATGKKFEAGIGNSKTKFVDDGVTIMNPILGQQPVGYFDSNNKLAMSGGPKLAWDIANKVISAGLSAGLPQANATAWAAGFKNDSFATVACPAWMLGQIKTNAGGHGVWDVADIPGGGGNWGGSWWTVPKQGKNTTAAADLVKWLVQPAQQIAVFKDAGNLPSQPALWTNPAIADYTNPNANNAPTGKIFTAAAVKLPNPPQFLGTKNGAVRVAVELDLTAVEQGKFNATSGWARAQKDAEKAAAG